MRQRPRPTVVVLGGEPPPAMQAVEQRAVVRYANEDRLADQLPGAEVLFVWNARSTVVASAWSKADALRWMHTATTGGQYPLSAEMIASDVQVTDSRGVFDEPIAEYVLGLALAFAKDLPARLRLQQRRVWQHRETERLSGKNVLVVGTGSIARAIGRKLTTAGMSVTGAGRIGRAGDPDLGIVLPMDRLSDGLRVADFVVLAAPLTGSTRGLMNARSLAAMRPTARLINIGRGGLVVQADLIEAVREGRIAGAALDVFADEQLPAASPLWDLPNVLISPHASGYVVGWREELVRLFEDNLARYLDGKPLRNAVRSPGKPTAAS
jgi:phosphoglycerate dehydrogenase-like enzyme